MESTEGYKLAFTKHAEDQLEKKRVGFLRAREAFENPDKVYPNKKYAGQFRVVGNGICLIGRPMGNTFKVFTVYEDGVMTPPRPDQLETEEGRAYAELYEKAQRNKGRVARNNEYYPRAKKRAQARDVPHTYVR
ncbi:hypothetical protein SEA_GILSON_226 [Streptomyces phage Gilson]|uniref:Uncharacterized protein n=1 Tax=Streptomyces phage Gilson TaxID=2488789 RepID=A0A3Q9R4X2_9CAUD|nr:hypothetical protein HWB98_gp058 [Streptomyces phage Gilson]AZU97271.1 hypothetical protein SEA_GILSON_226 [Streptomyces phage Gilson]